jgi:hypothetical protein
MLNNNELRYYKNHSAHNDKAWQGHRMYQNPAILASKIMHEPLVPMFFPVLGAHVSGSEFQYPDRF